MGTAIEDQTQVGFTKDISLQGPVLHLSVGIQSSAKPVEANNGLLQITKAERFDRDCGEGIRLT